MRVFILTLAQVLIDTTARKQRTSKDRLGGQLDPIDA